MFSAFLPSAYKSYSFDEMLPRFSPLLSVRLGNALKSNAPLNERSQKKKMMITIPAINMNDSLNAFTRERLIHLEARANARRRAVATSKCQVESTRSNCNNTAGELGRVVSGSEPLTITFRAEVMPGRISEERTFPVAAVLPSGRIRLVGLCGEYAPNAFERKGNPVREL
jgi:hypothetical protein